MSAIIVWMIATWFSLSLIPLAHANLGCGTSCLCNMSDIQLTTGCQCTAKTDNALSINCRQSVPDTQQLSQQIDSLLSAEHIRERLKSLTISDTPLTLVPASVCQLLNLTSLNISGNKFSELRDNCFRGMTKLVRFSAIGNSIRHLQDGLFDGLTRLKYLYLYRNKIESIGLGVFANSSGLDSLRVIQLAYNRLTSLEPWWYDRCVIGNGSYPVVAVILTKNSISNLTNQMRFDFDCRMKKPHGFVVLSYNRISHISDILDGWNIRSFEDMTCLANYQTYGSRFHIKTSRMGLACDCRDYEYFKWRRSHQQSDLFRDVNCRQSATTSPGYALNRASRISLSSFVCQSTDGCPSGCQCVYRPANATLHVDCSAANLSSLPLDLPPLSKSYTRCKLDFSNNKLLRGLEYRSYLDNTTILDVSNCSINAIDNKTWKSLVHIYFLSLHSNRLQSLPQDVTKWNSSLRWQRVSLANNPWTCYCKDKWFGSWLKSVDGRISLPNTILCASPPRLSGSSIVELSEDSFCHDLKSKMVIASSTSTGVFAMLLVALLLSAVTYRVRFRLYRRFKFHPFDRDECRGEDMDYDVFLCCSSEDHNPDALRILELLESSGYRVCYHYRDFVAGMAISDNICKAVMRSKRTVCLLTMDFLKSSHCMLEFDMAFHHLVAVKRKKRLIVLMTLDQPLTCLAKSPFSTATLEHYLRQYTYIDYKADDWLYKLLYALPLHGLLQTDQQNNDDIQLAERRY